jgi:hypothetical protein
MQTLTSKTSNTKKTNAIPEIYCNWKRFPKDPSTHFYDSFKKASAYGIVGGKGKGKSSLAEAICSHFPKIIDIYGSRDNEGLAWCRSPFKDSVAFLKGNSVTIDCNCADTLNASDITWRDLEKYKVVVSCAAFYTNMQEEWHCLGKLVDKLWRRMSWTEPWCVLIREASNLLYSRISLGDNQQAAKNYIIYVLREMRHCGYAVVLDTLRWYSIDIDVRTLADYTFLKAQGIEGLPRGLRFIYAYYSPSSIMRMKVYGFVTVSREGPIGHGYFDFPYWHKLETENLLQQLDLRITYKDVPYSGDDMATHVSDYEHVRIVKARIESTDGMEKLGDKIGRSSRTIFKHIKKHNAMVASVGECDKCLRVNSQYSKTLIE